MCTIRCNVQLLGILLTKYIYEFCLVLKQQVSLNINQLYFVPSVFYEVRIDF